MAPIAAVDWSLAERAARELARDGDRPATEQEQERYSEALRLAEHWLDASGLPSAPDAGITRVLDRAGWIDAAIVQLRRIIDPIAQASTEALVGLAAGQLGALDALLEEDPDALGAGPLGEGALDLDRVDLSAFGMSETDAAAMREQLRAMLGPDGGLPELLRRVMETMRGQDPGALLRPAAASLNALQAGQVIGTLARQVHGHRDLGVPTAPARTPDSSRSTSSRASRATTSTLRRSRSCSRSPRWPTGDSTMRSGGSTRTSSRSSHASLRR
jgi:uncharacterized protein (DUF2342 family)